jgi:hypothetical protein
MSATVFVTRLQNLRAMSDILQTKLYNGIILRVINLCPYVGHRFRGRADDQHLPQTRRSTDPQPLTVLMAASSLVFCSAFNRASPRTAPCKEDLLLGSEAVLLILFSS